MHYPQAQRDVHFGTAPFGRGVNERKQREEGQEEDFLEGLGEEGPGSGDTGSSDAGAQELVAEVSRAGGSAGERVYMDGGMFAVALLCRRNVEALG